MREEIIRKTELFKVIQDEVQSYLNNLKFEDGNDFTWFLSEIIIEDVCYSEKFNKYLRFDKKSIASYFTFYSKDICSICFNVETKEVSKDFYEMLKKAIKAIFICFKPEDFEVNYYNDEFIQQ